ncbi:MAG: PEP-CTERM sorting domain-containing protein, partial [Gammaproteobacteria bacterium]|nr:PEP-CTERM sorting domain-containing protein [Gammaproteobacteria bacterium]
DGVVVEDRDESASIATATAQQGVNPPAAGGDGASGIGTAAFPNPDGTGGSVGAASFVSGGGGASGEISSASGAFYIGEFIANAGPTGSSPFDLTVNLDIEGELFLQNEGTAALVLSFAAVDAAGDPIGGFTGIAAVTNPGLIFPGFVSLGFTDPFMQVSCLDFAAVPYECTATADMVESIVLADLIDGDVFGLFLSITTIATLPDGAAVSAAYANFANTVDISFTGGNVTALPSTIAAPEPASMALMLVGVLAIGLARRRRSV